MRAHESRPAQTTRAKRAVTPGPSAEAKMSRTAVRTAGRLRLQLDPPRQPRRRIDVRLRVLGNRNLVAVDVNAHPPQRRGSVAPEHRRARRRLRFAKRSVRMRSLPAAATGHAGRWAPAGPCRPRGRWPHSTRLHGLWPPAAGRGPAPAAGPGRHALALSVGPLPPAINPHTGGATFVLQ